MRKRKFQILVGTIAALVVAVFVLTTRENDPVYQGKRLSEHLAGLGYNAGFGFNPFEPTMLSSRVEFQHNTPTNHPALEAIDKVGPNALPMLVRMLGSKESRFKTWCRDTVPTLPIIGKLFQVKPADVRARREQAKAILEKRMKAAAALSRLGSRAAPVIPDIVALLEDSESAYAALLTLHSVRPTRERDILSLTNVLHVQPRPSAFGGPVELLHQLAILELSSFGPRAQGAVPTLTNCFSSSNSSTRAAAAVALVRIGASPKEIVPLIFHDITNSPTYFFGSFNRSLQKRDAMMEIWALGEYGVHSQIALQFLTDLQHSQSGNDPLVQKAAAQAMGKILADTNSASR